MTTSMLWLLVGLGLAVVVVRRHSVAILLVTVQSLVIAVLAIALMTRDSTEFLPTEILLAARAVVLPAILWVSSRRTREQLRFQPGLHPLVRLAIALAAVVALVSLLPDFELGTVIAGDITTALLAIGISIIALRKRTIFHVLGLLVADNGLLVAAISVPHGLPFVIELGTLLDTVVVVAVATTVQEHIFGQLGTGNTSLLRRLHD